MAFRSTSWELKRQSSEKFLCVAGVGLVHTLGGPGRHGDFSPRLYFTVPLRCILGGPHPILGVDSEGSAVFRDTVFEAFRRLAPFSLPPDHFATHDDVGEAIVARMHNDRLFNIVMRCEMVGEKRKRGQPAKRLEHRVTEYCTAFGIDIKCWVRAAQDAPEWYRKVETGAEVFMSAWSTKRVNETNARPAKELFAALPFELP